MTMYALVGGTLVLVGCQRDAVEHCGDDNPGDVCSNAPCETEVAWAMNLLKQGEQGPLACSPGNLSYMSTIAGVDDRSQREVYVGHPHAAAEGTAYVEYWDSTDSVTTILEIRHSGASEVDQATPAWALLYAGISGAA